MRANQSITRRRVLQTGAAMTLAATTALFADAPADRPRIGIGMHSYGEAWSAAKKNPAAAKFHDAQTFLDYALGIKAAGVQVAIGAALPAVCRNLGQTAEAAGAYLEGQTSLPKDAADLARFEADVSAAKESGAAIMRSVCFSGRRYESFDSAQAFREAAGRARASLQLAVPVLQRLGMQLAIENHKDFLVPELIALLRQIGSDRLGLCVDLGNSIALLEEPTAVVEAYAPLALSVHLKDIAIEMCDDGFLMSEVPLGEGMLDLHTMARTLLRHNPRINFNIEMITRDPLKIPCLTPRYQATFPARTKAEIAAALDRMKRHASPRPLPRVSGLPVERRIQIEDDNVRKCLAGAGEKLGFA
jgi:sugar phosphate isomerase/epimerase